MRKAKEEGLNIKVHWQDADSSASKHVNEYYPDAEIMICGGHAGKEHLKQLQSQAKRRKFDETLQKAHRKEFPEIGSVGCHCKEHIKKKKASKQPAGSDEKVEKPPKFKYIPCKKGCGCLTDSFCQRARNSFSNILSTSKSAAEFRA